MAGSSSYNLSDDLLNITNYATISHNKRTKEGDDVVRYPNDLQTFVGKTYVFKINAVMSGVNYFQACIITISKITSDDELLRLYMMKYNVDLDVTIISNHEELSGKTPSPPRIEKSRISKTNINDIGMPTAKVDIEDESFGHHSSEAKPSAKKKSHD
ncbi:hypothetical protein PIB30_034001 [Stylosanthes scabra]|uniref:Uncharacterized protein n=1 Tax=Stylosanthes scabra TaxID=79078 RepID=A0ABU6UFC8_9FABA|nr:hypothetical protein [Stylosanthes scabra]